MTEPEWVELRCPDDRIAIRALEWSCGDPACTACAENEDAILFAAFDGRDEWVVMGGHLGGLPTPDHVIPAPTDFAMNAKWAALVGVEWEAVTRALPAVAIFQAETRRLKSMLEPLLESRSVEQVREDTTFLDELVAADSFNFDFQRTA